jgi:hypothetical protein
MSIYAKLNEARAAFHSLKLEKTGHNKFAGYKYFELGDFLIPALKVFKEVGLCAIVSFDKEMARMEITDASAPMTNSGVNRQFITITSPMGSAALKGCHEVQNIGAVETYQRRYLWVAALEIIEHDALDATTGSDKEPKGVVAAVVASLPELSDGDREYYDTLADNVTQTFNNLGPMRALERVMLEKLEVEQRVHLEQRLDSKVRSGLKQAGTLLRAEKAKA